MLDQKLTWGQHLMPIDAARVPGSGPVQTAEGGGMRSGTLRWTPGQACSGAPASLAALPPRTTTISLSLISLCRSSQQNGRRRTTRSNAGAVTACASRQGQGPARDHRPGMYHCTTHPWAVALCGLCALGCVLALAVCGGRAQRYRHGGQWSPRQPVRAK